MDVQRHPRETKLELHNRSRPASASPTWALTRGGEGRINIRNAPFRDDMQPLDPSIDIPFSRDFSRAYIHHLFKAGELLGMQIVAPFGSDPVVLEIARRFEQARPWDQRWPTLANQG